MHFTSENLDIKLPEIEFKHGEIPPSGQKYMLLTIRMVIRLLLAVLIIIDTFK